MQNDQRSLYITYGETVLKLRAEKQIDPSDMIHVVPLNYNDQVPILFEIKKETSSKILNYSIIDDKHSPNRLIKFSLGSLEKNEIVTIRFCYWVLIKNRNYKDLPKATQIPKEHELPSFTKKWLGSTEAIQSDNFLIKMTARFLWGLSNNLLKLAVKTVYFVCYHRVVLSDIRILIESKTFLRNIFLPKRYWTGLMDAASGLLFGGLCSTKTNLIVALFRANRVPARVLIVNPLYYRIKDLEWIDGLHYIIEFYVPNYGWARANSGRAPYQPKNDIVLKIVYPEDENEAGNGLSYYGGMVPWFWFSNEHVLLDFPEDIFTLYKKPKGSGIPITTKKILNNFKVEKKLADIAFILAQKNWEMFITHFGKKLDNSNSKNYEKAIQLKKQMIQDLTNSDIKNCLENAKKINGLLRKIKAQ